MKLPFRPPTGRPLVATAALLAITALSACSTGKAASSSDAGSSPAASSSAPSNAPSGSSTGSSGQAVSLTIKDFAYGVPTTVAPGAKVTVTNKDSQAHTFTSRTKGAFDVAVPGGASKTFTAPTKPGTYQIYCVYHANMAGTLKVG